MTARENAETADLTLEVGRLRAALEELRIRDDNHRLVERSLEQTAAELEKANELADDEMHKRTVAEAEVERLRGELEAMRGERDLYRKELGSSVVELKSCQEMRESLGAMLKLANDNTAREMAKCQSLTEQLAEATGLLERFVCEEIGHGFRREIEAFLSRAPAQAAEPEGQVRTAAAEAKLTLVREALQMPEYYATKDPDDLLGSEIAEIQSCLRDALALLAPSQGEGGGGHG